MKTLPEILAELRDDIRRNRPRAGPGIAVAVGENGTTIGRLGPAAGASGPSPAMAFMVPVKVTDGGPGHVYTCDVYGDGRYVDDGAYETEHSATETDKKLVIIQIHASETVPAGSWFMARRVGYHFEAQAPIWLGPPETGGGSSGGSSGS